jgi:AcrR family transcriptional regulator
LQPPREERRARLARYFVEVVEPLLEAGESYADVSVERLIKEVDISRSTFYVYFDDKGDLLGAMAADVTRDLAEAGSAWFELATDASRADLRDALSALFGTYRKHQTLLGAITEAAAYDPRVRAQHLALVEEAVRGLADHIAAQQKAGGAPKHLDPRRTAQWLTWMYERALYQLVGPASAGESRKLLDSATDLVWRALYEGYHRD